MSIAVILSFLQFILPYFGIFPPYYPIPEKKPFEPKISADFRNEDGWYGTKAIDLNYPPFELKNSFRLDGIVPHPGKITVFVENYTVGDNIPKFFEIEENSAKHEKDWFNVNEGSFERKISISMFPRVKITSTQYVTSLERQSICQMGTINVLYRIEYYDIKEDKTTNFFIVEPFAGKMEIRTSTPCF